MIGGGYMKKGLLLFQTILIIMAAVGGSFKNTYNHICSSNREQIKQVAKIFEPSEVNSVEKSLKLLKEGNTRYVEEKLENIDLSSRKREQLASGQKPFAIIVTCSDSRVVPEYIFNQGLGELFVIRTAGNVVDKVEVGSIEYAVEHLKTPLIVIMGHEDCGAVKAAIEVNGKEVHGNIGVILEKIHPAVETAKKKNLYGEELIEEAIYENVRNVAKVVEAKSPIVKGNLKNGKVKIVKAKYMMKSGKVEWLIE